VPLLFFNISCNPFSTHRHKKIKQEEKLSGLFPAAENAKNRQILLNRQFTTADPASPAHLDSSLEENRPV